MMKQNDHYVLTQQIYLELTITASSLLQDLDEGGPLMPLRVLGHQLLPVHTHPVDVTNLAVEHPDFVLAPDHLLVNIQDHFSLAESWHMGPRHHQHLFGELAPRIDLCTLLKKCVLMK